MAGSEPVRVEIYTRCWRRNRSKKKWSHVALRGLQGHENLRKKFVRIHLSHHWKIIHSTLSLRWREEVLGGTSRFGNSETYTTSPIGACKAPKEETTTSFHQQCCRTHIVQRPFAKEEGKWCGHPCIASSPIGRNEPQLQSLHAYGS